MIENDDKQRCCAEYRAFMDNYEALQKQLKGLYDNQRIDREKRIRKDLDAQSAAKGSIPEAPKR